MTRRISTLLVSGVIFVALLAVALTLPVPYVILGPGPTYNTLGTDDSGNPIISIKGHPVRHKDGHLNLTTVNVPQGAVTSVAAFIGWIKHDEVVVPRSTVYPPGQSQQQVNQQDTQDFVQSQDSAIYAALCQLGYPKEFGVISVPNDSPAAGKVQPGDELISLGGHPVTSTAQLTAALSNATPGTRTTLVVKRDGRTVSIPITLTEPPKGGKGARIGITVGNGCLAPFSVDLGLGGQIGGPSAGLMFALGIIDELGSTDLTGGRFIAGTGTIDANGTVGPIGGIQLKMIAARRAGASVFLAPQGNCPDVRGATPAGLGVVKVDTLQHAIEYLEDLQQGKPVPHC